MAPAAFGYTLSRPFGSASLARATASVPWRRSRGPYIKPKKRRFEEARSRLSGAGYSNSGPASSCCCGSASGRSRAATDGACASAAAGLEVMGAFAGFRNFRSFLLIPINKAHATTAKERPTAMGTTKVASALERRFGTGATNDGEAVGGAVSKVHRQISTEYQVACESLP